MRKLPSLMVGAAPRGLLSGCALLALTAITAQAQQTTGVPGAPDATTTIDGRYLPPPPQPFGGEIDLNAAQSKPCVAGARGAAEGRAEYPADHDRRRRLRRAVHLRRRHPDAGARPHRRRRPALHQLPLHLAVLADARGADHRAQPPLGRLRRGLRGRDRLPRLQQHHRQGQRHHRPHPAGERLSHLLVRQGPQHADLRRRARPGRSTSGRPAWASSISTASSAATPASGSRTCSATPRRSIPMSAIPAGT